MVQIIVVNGFPESGKTTFEDFCLGYLGVWGSQISTVTFVKEIAKKCGWDGTKTIKNRKFLSDLKNLLTEWDDVPMKKIQKFVMLKEADGRIYDVEDHPFIVFVDSREPAEIERFRKEMGAKAVLIRRPGDIEKGEQALNDSDREILDAEYDYIIQNDGTKEELAVKAQLFVGGLMETLKRKESSI